MVEEQDPYAPLDRGQLAQLVECLPPGADPSIVIQALILLLGADRATYLDVHTPAPADGARVLALTGERAVVVEAKVEVPTVGRSRLRVEQAFSRPLRDVKTMRLLRGHQFPAGGDPARFGRWQLEYPDGETIELPIDDADDERSMRAATEAVAAAMDRG